MTDTPGRGANGLGRRPSLVLLDVNETLSDMSAMADRFVAVGAPGASATSWFAAVLRDGFALTAVGANERFATVAAAALRVSLAGERLDRPVEEAVEHVMAGFSTLPVHDDVVPGIRALAGAGVRVVTLSNGSASVAEGLLERAGVRDRVEAVLSVEDAPLWKPAAAAYTFALDRCGVEAADAVLAAVHPWDVDGAARAGLSTCWVDRGRGVWPEHVTRPDVTVDGLTGLARELGG